MRDWKRNWTETPLYVSLVRMLATMAALTRSLRVLQKSLGTGDF